MALTIVLIFLERREIFKKQKLPLHDEDSESEDQEIVKENKPSKKLVTNVKQHPRKSSRHHSDRHAQKRVKFEIHMDNFTILERGFTLIVATSFSC